MTRPTDPLLARISAGLEWPTWSEWANETSGDLPTPDADWAPVNAAQRGAAVQTRRARARTTERGGPWLELFDNEIAKRLAAEADADLGPLAMKSFAVKALVAVTGRVTTAGSPVREGEAPEPATAPIVQALESLGAIALGTVTMHEFAFGVTGVNAHFGTALNPSAPDRVPGGSSSGSAAAVADGSADFAIGTDTGGSVRIPSAFCGVAGFKPAHGTYPATGVFPLSATLDHVGFHAPRIADIDVIHRALGHRTTKLDRSLTIGVARTDMAAADDDVRSAVEAALDRLEADGATLVDVAWPDSEATFVASTAIMFSEAAAIHRRMLARAGDRYGADIRSRLELGASLTGTEVAAAHRLRQSLIDQVRRTLVGVDVIASPTVPIIAPLLSDADDPSLPARIVANTRLANVVGLPALTLPVEGASAPVGLQLLGLDNAEVLAAGRWSEERLAT